MLTGTEAVAAMVLKTTALQGVSVFKETLMVSWLAGFVG
jgi:hypothetical protein